MAAPRPRRRRPRRGSLERPVNGRMYRGTWLLVGLPLLAAAFSVGRAESLPPPTLPPTFDRETARFLAADLATKHPDRSPGSLGAVNWVDDQFALLGLEPERKTFEAEIPGRERTRLTNVLARAPGRSNSVLVVLAHRDNLGTGAGANDNASGTAALIELARAYAQTPGSAGEPVRPAHTIVFLSTDGGAFGGIGAARFAADPAYLGRIEAVIVLDSIAGPGPPRLELAGDEPRSPAPGLVQTAAERIAEQTGSEPERPRALRQLFDLGFPFSLTEQAPFVARGIPAVTLTSAVEPPPSSEADATTRLNGQRLGEIGRAAQQLLASLDGGLEVVPAAGAYVYLGPRIIAGWAIQLVLIAAVLPFLAAAVDLFARCRRRRIPLGPALRSYRSRLAFWLSLGAIAWVLGLVGAWPEGADRPISPESAAARSWPLVGLAVLVAAGAVAWLVARERLLPRREVAAEEELGGTTAALLVLGVLALVTIAFNPFALLFLLPSLHAWIWLPQLRSARRSVRAAVLAGGLAGPILLVASFAGRLGIGLDAPWYVAAIAAVGYVGVPPVLLFLAWAAAAGQLTALTAGRYAPYPTPEEQPATGPVRALVRRSVSAVRNRRREPDEEAHALEG